MGIMLFRLCKLVVAVGLAALGAMQIGWADDAPLQAYTRSALSLNGEWRIIVDPYENGYYNYRH